MDFMFEGNHIDAKMVKEPGDGQMIGGNDALYTVVSEVTKVNKKYKWMEKTIKLKASNHQLNSK